MSDYLTERTELSHVTTVPGCRAHAQQALLVCIGKSPLAQKIGKKSEKYFPCNKKLEPISHRENPNFLEFS